MSASDEKVIPQIRFEIAEIDRLLAVYADLLARVQQRQPDTVEIAAVATVLHSFYNGLENILLSIAKGVDRAVPSGAQSHRDLLVQMTRTTTKRRAVISSDSAKKIADYLGFRHFYRHSYSFLIEWSELKKLVVPLDHVWAQFKREFVDFADSLTMDK